MLFVHYVMFLLTHLSDCYSYKYSLTSCLNILFFYIGGPELQIRRGNRDNSEIFFLFFQ